MPSINWSQVGISQAYCYFIFGCIASMTNDNLFTRTAYKVQKGIFNTMLLYKIIVTEDTHKTLANLGYNAEG